MRTPAQASINIIEKEDAAGMRMQAKYHAMENQAVVVSRSNIAFFVFIWLVCVQIETLAKRFDREYALDSACFVLRDWNYFCCIDCKTCRRQRLLDEFDSLMRPMRRFMFAP